MGKKKLKILEKLRYFVVILLVLPISKVQLDQHDHPHGRQIQLQIDDLQTFNQTELINILEHPEVKDRKVMVLSIIGAYRKGKSFFLDYCLRYLYANYQSINRVGKEDFVKNDDWMGEPDEPLSGFSWAPGSIPISKGILVWNDVFLCDKPNGEKIAIILIDTQGLFELGGDPNVEANIFGITSFLSSVEIFNLNDVIQENQLGYLKMITDFSKIAMDRQTNGTNSSVQMASKPFQELLFLVRDWSDDDMGYKWEGGKKYSEKIFTIPKKSNSASSSIRNGIKDSFDKISAFLLKHPGTIVKSKEFNGSWSELNEDFISQFKELIESLFAPEKLVTKKIFGNEVTGQELSKFTENIFKSFLSLELSKIDSLFDAVVESNLNNLVENLIGEYKMKMNSILDYSRTSFIHYLHENHNRTRDEIFAKFRANQKMGSKHIEARFEKYLSKQMSDYFNEWQENKKGQFKAYIQDNVYKFFTEFKKVLSNQLDYDDKNFIENLPMIYNNTSSLIIERFDSSPLLGDLIEDTAYKQDLEQKITSNFEQWKNYETSNFLRNVENKTKVLVEEFLNEYETKLEHMNYGETNFKNALSAANDTLYNEIIQKFDKVSEMGVNEITDYYKNILIRQMSSYFVQWKSDKREALKKSLRESIDSLSHTYKMKLDVHVKVNDSNILQILSDAHQKIYEDIMREFQNLSKTGDAEIDDGFEKNLSNQIDLQYFIKKNEVDTKIRSIAEMREQQHRLKLLIFSSYKNKVEPCVDFKKTQFMEALCDCQEKVRTSILNEYEQSSQSVSENIRNETKLELQSDILEYFEKWKKEKEDTYKKIQESRGQGTWRRYPSYIPVDAVMDGTCAVAMSSGGYIGEKCPTRKELKTGTQWLQMEIFYILIHPNYVWTDLEENSLVCIKHKESNGNCICRVWNEGLGIVEKGKCCLFKGSYKYFAEFDKYDVLKIKELRLD